MGSLAHEFHMGAIKIIYKSWMGLTSLTMAMVGKQEPQSLNHGQRWETISLGAKYCFL